MAACEGNSSIRESIPDFRPQNVPKSMQELKNMKVKDLRKLCKEFDLESTGTGVVLRDRVSAELNLNSDALIIVDNNNKCSLFESEAVKIAYRNLGPLNRLKLKWSKDVRLMPYFDHGRLKKYLIHSTDKTFDEQSIKAYKTLRAYALYEESHLDKLEFCSPGNSPFCFFRCDCIPSQGTTETYKVMVCLDNHSGSVYGAHCVCVAGLGEVCSHAAALLFCLEAIVASGVKSLPNERTCTEKLCVWLAPKGRKVEPVPLSEVNVYRPRYGKPPANSVKATSKNYDPRGPCHRTVYQEDVAMLQQLLAQSNPLCPFMVNLELCRFPSKTNGNTLPPSHDDNLTGTAADISDNTVVLAQPEPVAPTREECIQKAHSELFNSVCEADRVTDSAVKLSEQQYQMKFEEYINRVTCTPEFVTEVETATRGQSENPLWYQHRVGRLTASKFGSVQSRRRTTPPDRLVRDVMCYNNAPNMHIPALVHGRTTEAEAREVYIAHIAGKGTPVTVEECGLFVNQQSPWCGASPDGTVFDSKATDPNGLLEIKCPFVECFISIEELVRERKKFYLVKGEKLNINCRHEYYAQV